MNTLDDAFERLSRSAFRRKFRLQGRELAYLQTWGVPHVMKQAADLIRQRLAPAEPKNDGRQTPWRNHPVFVAQHATATCCRGCLEKTHGIAKGHALDEDEMRHVLATIERWLRAQLDRQCRTAGLRVASEKSRKLLLSVKPHSLSTRTKKRCGAAVAFGVITVFVLDVATGAMMR
jgi:predicted Fe-S protein YdhL (DUF1289 family)